MIPKFGKYTEEHLAEAIKMCRSDPDYEAFKEQSYQKSRNGRNNNNYISEQASKIKTEPEFAEFITLCDKLRQKGYNPRLTLSQNNLLNDDIIVSDYQELPGKYSVKINEQFINESVSLNNNIDEDFQANFNREQRENNRKWYGGRVFILQTITENKTYTSFDEIADDVIFYRDFLVQFYQKSQQINITDKFTGNREYNQLFAIDIDKVNNRISKAYGGMRMELLIIFADIIKID